MSQVEGSSSSWSTTRSLSGTRRSRGTGSTLGSSMTEVLSPGEVAERWGVSADTVRNLIAVGTLRAFRVGSVLRIKLSTVLKYEEGKPCKLSSPKSLAARPGTSSGMTGWQLDGYQRGRQIAERLRSSLLSSSVGSRRQR